MSGVRGSLWKLAAAAAVAAAALAVSSAQAIDKPGLIRITGVQTSNAHIDHGREGISAGDVDVYRFLLYNRRITPKSIGRADVVCTSTGTTAQSCTATYTLPRGAIAVSGLVRSRLIYELAIVGGTGLYDNVRGALTATSLRRKPVTELLVFRLVT